MIAQLQAPEQTTARRTTERNNAGAARLYKSIPEHVDHIPNPEYLTPGAEQELFGPQARTVPVPQWRPAVEFEDGQEEAQTAPAGPNLSRPDEALLFRRYNCARYHLGNLMTQQTQSFVRERVGEILSWYRRVLANRSALTGANMALVVAMVKRTSTNPVDFDELVAEGNLALLRAVDNFDFSRGFKFSTYACTAILRTFSQLAAKARIYRKRFPTVSEPEMEPSDEVQRRHVDQGELALENLQRALMFNRAGLTDVEQTVLGARFAVAGHNRVHTLREVGGLVRLTAERVRQVQKKALAKLRVAMEHAFWPAATSPGKTPGALADPTTAIPGRLGLGVPAAAQCGT